MKEQMTCEKYYELKVDVGLSSWVVVDLEIEKEDDYGKWYKVVYSECPWPPEHHYALPYSNCDYIDKGRYRFYRDLDIELTTDFWE